MANLKRDDDFERFIAIGARAVIQAKATLSQQGHDVIELDRGATETQIWSDSQKVKATRLPDLYCLGCGRKFEVRGKAEMNLTLSDAENNPNRRWFSGLDDVDYICLVEVTGAIRNVGTGYSFATVSLPQFVEVGDLKQIPPSSKATKGNSDGSETSVTWKTMVAKSDGTIAELDVPARHIKTKYGTQNPKKYAFWRDDKSIAQMNLGDSFKAGDIILSTVAVSRNIQCTQHPLTLAERVENYLTSPDYLPRRAGARLAEHLSSLDPSIETSLCNLMGDIQDPLCPIDAAVSLMCHGVSVGEEKVRSLIVSQSSREAVETLVSVTYASKLRKKSIELATEIIGQENLSEHIRAAAAWSLGRNGMGDQLPALLNALPTGTPESVLEAVAKAVLLIAIRDAKSARPFLLNDFGTARGARLEALAWVFGRKEVRLNAQETQEIYQAAAGDDTVKSWLANAIGMAYKEEELHIFNTTENSLRGTIDTARAVTRLEHSWISNLQ